MAETRFFKKFGDNFKFVFSDQRNCVIFTTLDGLVGYFATNSVQVQAELDQAIKDQRSAIEEIKAEEFHRDYVQKKTETPPLNGRRSNQSWREEMAGTSRLARGPLERLGADGVAAVVGVNGKSDIAEEAVHVAPAQREAIGTGGRVIQDTHTRPEAPVKPLKEFKPNLSKKGKPPTQPE